MVNTKDIEKLAELSRLNLTPEEKENFAKEIDAILGYVSQVQKIFQDSEVASGRKELQNVFREDINPHENGAFAKELMKEVPKKEGNYVKVKKIF